MREMRVAVIATDGVEEVEFTEPVAALREVGVTVEIVSPKFPRIQSMRGLAKGMELAVDVPIDAADPRDYDMLILPGGVANPDKLRTDDLVVNFVRAMAGAGKVVAAICHGPWLLAEADVVRGRTVTSWPSLQTDLRNAGAHWVDEELVVDGDIITSRKPDDLPAFCARLIEECGADVSLRGRHLRVEVAYPEES